jgi:CubicO group peptidase (beta-lactamase class C family)
MRAVLAAAAVLSCVTASPTLAYEPPAAVLEQVKGRADFSGVAVVDAGDGKPFVHTAGFARGQQPVTAQTRFDIGSIGKIMTAVAVMQLVETGKVDLEAPIGRYLPDLPEAAKSETVASVMQHTAGLGDVLFSPETRELSRAADNNRDYYLLAVKQPVAAAGQHRYSNTGYVVLGELVARVSGQPYETYLQQKVMSPAGMTRAMFARSDRSDAPDVAMGHLSANFDPAAMTLGAPPPRPVGPYTREAAELNGWMTSAAGGLYATAADLAAFGRALLDGKLISQASVDRICQPLHPGPGIGYGLGCMVEPRGGFGHNGGRPGMQAILMMSRETNAVVAVVGNREGQTMGLFRPLWSVAYPTAAS